MGSPARNGCSAIGGLVLALASASGCAGLPSPVRKTPAATPIANPSDRPIALKFPRYGPLFVQFGDKTVAYVATWSNGNAATVWRTPYPVRDFQVYTNEVCVLTEAGEAGCLPSEETLRPLSPVLVEPTATSLALGPSFEVCVTLPDGTVRCSLAEARLENRDFAQRLYARAGAVKRILSGTPCVITLDDRLVCGGGGRDETDPKLVLEGIEDASLVASGGWTVSGCVLKKDHTVACWGSNRNGEVGIGRRSWTEALHVVPSLTDVARVSYAPGKACAIRRDGALFCWGADFGADGLRAGAAVPRCEVKRTKVTVEPCPKTDGDNPCERARYDARRSGENLEERVEVLRDPHEQCIAPGEPAYASSPTRISLVPNALDVATGDRHAFYLRADGIMIGVGESADYTENAISPVPNDPRVTKKP